MLPVATLVYETPAESACPEEAPFRAAVSARLGRDPFVLSADRTVFVRLSGSGSTWLATVRVDGAEASDERRIEANGSCAELATAAALAVSIAIDPLRGADAPAEPAPAPEPKPATPRAEPAPRTPNIASRPAESSWRVRAGARAWLGAVPHFSAGPVLGARYQRGAWSLGLAGFGVLSRREPEEGERAVSAGVWGVELEPCAHLFGWRGCAVVQGGRLLAQGHGVDDSLEQSAWHAAAGANVGYELDIGRFRLVPVLSGAARLRTTTLSLTGQSIWLTPRWLGSLGVEVEYRL